jgi:hypothetical protein
MEAGGIWGWSAEGVTGQGEITEEWVMSAEGHNQCFEDVDSWHGPFVLRSFQLSPKITWQVSFIARGVYSEDVYAMMRGDEAQVVVETVQAALSSETNDIVCELPPIASGPVRLTATRFRDSLVIRLEDGEHPPVIGWFGASKERDEVAEGRSDQARWFVG